MTSAGADARNTWEVQVGSSSNSGSGSTFSASPPLGRPACSVPHHLTGQGCQLAHVLGQLKGPDPGTVCTPAWKPQHLPTSPPKQPVAWQEGRAGTPEGRRPPSDWAPRRSNRQRGQTDRAPRQKAPGGCLAVGTRQVVRCGSHGERPPARMQVLPEAWFAISIQA